MNLRPHWMKHQMHEAAVKVADYPDWHVKEAGGKPVSYRAQYGTAYARTDTPPEEGSWSAEMANTYAYILKHLDNGPQAFDALYATLLNEQMHIWRVQPQGQDFVPLTTRQLAVILKECERCHLIYPVRGEELLPERQEETSTNRKEPAV